jgi:hypothetical protein
VFAAEHLRPGGSREALIERLRRRIQRAVMKDMDGKVTRAAERAGIERPAELACIGPERSRLIWRSPGGEAKIPR